MLNYIDRLDEHRALLVTGTCKDPVTGTIHVVGRTDADPPALLPPLAGRTARGRGWVQDSARHQGAPGRAGGLPRAAVPVLARHQGRPTSRIRACPCAQPSSSSAEPGRRQVRHHLGLYFSIFRNGSWAPAQAAKGKLFDKPLVELAVGERQPSVEALYTLKVQTPRPRPATARRCSSTSSASARSRSHNLYNVPNDPLNYPGHGHRHYGRRCTSGARCSTGASAISSCAICWCASFSTTATDSPPWYATMLLQHAKSTYGPDAQPLLPLPDNRPIPTSPASRGLVPRPARSRRTPAPPAPRPRRCRSPSRRSARSSRTSARCSDAAPVPFRVVGPATDLAFDPASYFFFQDNRRCYFVESQRFYRTGSAWSPVRAVEPGQRSVPGALRLPPLLPPVHAAVLAPARQRRLPAALRPQPPAQSGQIDPSRRRRLQLPDQLPAGARRG